MKGKEEDQVTLVPTAKVTTARQTTVHVVTLSLGPNVDSLTLPVCKHRDPTPQ